MSTTDTNCGAEGGRGYMVEEEESGEQQTEKLSVNLTTDGCIIVGCASHDCRCVFEWSCMCSTTQHLT